jgi:sec-independent protein translocase protein TatA
MFDGIFAPDKLILVALVALILFGPKRLPSVGRKVGEWLGEFRKATGGLGEELKAGLNETTAEPAKSIDVPAEPGPRPPAPPA